MSNLTGVPGPLQLDGTNIIWTEGDTSQVFSIDTSTLARRTLFLGLRVAYRLSGNTIVSKFGSSFTTFNTCTLSSNCPTFTMLSPANTTGGDFRIDNATQKLFFVDLSFPDMVQASSFVTWNPAMFLTLPVGFNSVGLLAQINGFLYGTALPNAGGPLVFWRASTASATNTAAILSTQIPGNVGFPVVGANATKLFYLTDSGLILSFPPNGSGNAVPNTFFNAGIQGGMAVDDSFVYWSDYVIGNVYRCSAALTVCTTPEIIASGQPSASSLVQDAKALYWQRAQQSPMHQIMRWAK